MPEGINVHEVLELHELLSFKNVCCTKSSTMGALVSDPELKSLLSQDSKLTKQHIRDLMDLIQSTPL